MPLPTANGAGMPGIVPMQVDEADANVAIAVETLSQNHLVHNANIDLETYCSAYVGLARLNRLLFIADHCPSLRIEALRMAITYVMTTYNTAMYTSINQKLREAMSLAPTLPDAVAGLGVPALDTLWIETTAKKAAIKLEKLDNDLKNYKSNSIKESIRRGHDDLGDHYMDCGDLPNALKSYTRARDYCTSAKHVVSMCLNVIKVSVYLQNWSHVLNYVSKAESQSDMSGYFGKDAAWVLSYLNTAAGLAELHQEKYKNAAKRFIKPAFDFSRFPEMCSTSGIATYGVMCALATFDRQELQTQILTNSAFKLFLELEPQIRDILHMFHDSRYAECLTLMERVKDNLLLDIYLAPHVNKLYSKIRSKALCQYFSPYVSADMRKMAAAFNTNVNSLEDELMQLILDGQINARIDSHSKVLYAKLTDARSSTFERAFQAGDEYHRRTRALLFRGACLRQNIAVRTNSRAEGSEMSLSPGNLAGGSRN